MRLYKLKLFVLLLLCLACRERTDSSILFTEDRLLKNDLTSYIHKVNLLDLNLPEDITIGAIQNLIFYEDDMVLSENGNTSSLLIFGQNGDFKRQLLKLGGGPGEYFNIDFFMVTADLIYIYDRHKMNLLVYDYKDLNFISSIKLDYYLVGGIAIDDQNNLFLVSDHTLDDGHYKGYGFVNFNENKENFLAQKPHLIEGHQPSAFSIYDGRVFLTEAFTEKTYEISSGNLEEVSHIDFGTRAIGKNIAKLEEADDFHDLLDRGSFRFVAHHYMKEEGWDIFNFYHENIEQIHIGFHNRQTGLNHTYIPQSTFEYYLIQPLRIKDKVRYSVLYPGESKSADLHKLGIESIEKLTILSYKFNLESIR